MAAKYLSHKIEIEEYPTNITNLIRKCFKKISIRVIKKVQKSSKIPRLPLNLNLIISHMNKEDNKGSKFFKVKISEKVKEDIRDCLKSIKHSIDNLNLSKRSSPTRLSSLHPGYQENNTEKSSRDSSKILKKMSKLKSFVKESSEKIKSPKSQKEPKKAKKEVLKEFSNRKTENPKDREDLPKVRSDSSINTKQNHRFLMNEERLNSDSVIPELEKRKAELQKKRQLLMPGVPSQLKDHFSWYSQFKAQKKSELLKELNDPSRENSVISSSNLVSIQEYESKKPAPDSNLPNPKSHKFKIKIKPASKQLSPIKEKFQLPSSLSSKPTTPKDLINPSSNPERSSFFPYIESETLNSAILTSLKAKLFISALNQKNL